MKIPNLIAIALLTAGLALNAQAVKTRKPNKPEPPEIRAYDKGVNETLDTVMWIHERLTNERRRITWAELNEEVCREMNVKRTQPWERR